MRRESGTWRRQIVSYELTREEVLAAICEKYPEVVLPEPSGHFGIGGGPPPIEFSGLCVSVCIRVTTFDRLESESSPRDVDGTERPQVT